LLVDAQAQDVRAREGVWLGDAEGEEGADHGDAEGHYAIQELIP
jgi:hypothetical protein